MQCRGPHAAWHALEALSLKGGVTAEVEARWVDSTTAAGAAARAIQLLVSTGQSWKDFNSTDFQKTALLKAGDRPEASRLSKAIGGEIHKHGAVSIHVFAENIKSVHETLKSIASVPSQLQSAGRRVVFVPSLGWASGPDGQKSRRSLRIYAKSSPSVVGLNELELDSLEVPQFLAAPDVVFGSQRRWLAASPAAAAQLGPASVICLRAMRCKIDSCLLGSAQTGVGVFIVLAKLGNAFYGALGTDGPGSDRGPLTVAKALWEQSQGMGGFAACDHLQSLFQRRHGGNSTPSMLQACGYPLMLCRLGTLLEFSQLQELVLVDLRSTEVLTAALSGSCSRSLRVCRASFIGPESRKQPLTLPPAGLQSLESSAQVLHPKLARSDIDFRTCFVVRMQAAVLNGLSSLPISACAQWYPRRRKHCGDGSSSGRSAGIGWSCDRGFALLRTFDAAWSFREHVCVARNQIECERQTTATGVTVYSVVLQLVEVFIAEDASMLATGGALRCCRSIFAWLRLLALRKDGISTALPRRMDPRQRSFWEEVSGKLPSMPHSEMTLRVAHLFPSTYDEGTHKLC
ncbi:unnamed protein product [Symbiodinium natans]|uniref:Uncharacterized protein n=1 Tax=Symbiodinium natans TaxID=878477 RepID=A0A812RH20_9DINO|nr:unnamed protein product [Symbiodinium natans]